ncbi:MAG: radical SAM family heme chaperone HemW [Caldilineaceae bacterium]
MDDTHQIHSPIQPAWQHLLPHSLPWQQLGLYIHIPFCAKKCPYCDFNTYAGLDDLFQQTVDALCLEMQNWQKALQRRPINTIFLGGGTPTILSPAQLSQLFTAIHRTFQVSETCEITCEANPGTVDRSKFEVLRALGVNRLSIGVQSFQSDELQFLGRIHNATDVYRAFEAARSAGFTNINLDFIFGLPDQQPEAWQKTLTSALALAPDHLSLYSLIVEPNTPLHHWVESGKVAGTDDDLAADLFEMAMTTLADAGYTHYEVSNWARSQRYSERTPTAPLVCEHNLIYWRNQEYLGIGPGAHSHLQVLQPSGVVPAPIGPVPKRRWSNRKAVPGYVKRMQRGDSVEDYGENISTRLAMGETMMLGLRLLQEGVAFERFAAMHQVELTTVFADELRQLEAWGLITIDDTRVCLSPRGLLLGNQVFSYFLPDESEQSVATE